MSEAAIKCVTVSHGGSVGYVLPINQMIDLQWDAMEFDLGEKLELEVCEYTQAELDAFPEFEGW